MKILITITAIFLAVTSYGEKVGTQVSFQKDALPYFIDAPILLNALTNAFDISDIGEGRIIPSGMGLQPEKISPPFTFLAKPKGCAGAYSLVIRIPMRIGDTNGRLPLHRIEIQEIEISTEQGGPAYPPQGVGSADP